MSMNQRHKKEETGTQESDRVFYIGPKKKKPTCIICYRVLVLRKSCLNSILSN